MENGRHSEAAVREYDARLVRLREIAPGWSGMDYRKAMSECAADVAQAADWLRLKVRL